MKKITKLMLFVAFMCLTFGVSASTAVIDFEPTGIGYYWGWNGFENSGDATAPLVANPSATGINTSATCLKQTISAGSQPWAGVQPGGFNYITPFYMDATTTIVKVMVYKSVISPVGIKWENSAGGSKGEIKVSNTLINQWEELTFDFTSRIDAGLQVSRIIIFPDFPDTRTAGSVCYIDNITLNNITIPAQNFDLSTTSISSPATASSPSFNIISTNTWAVASNQTWCVPSAASGSGNATINLAIEANANYNNRTAIVTITGSDATTKTVTVTQEAAVFTLPDSPTPTVSAANVISVFSDAYTSGVSALDTQYWYNASWSNATSASSTNNVKKVTVGGTTGACLGFIFTAIDISSMAKLHMDIYATVTGTVAVGVPSGGDHYKLNIAVTANQWTPIDLSLTIDLLKDGTGEALTAANLTAINQVGIWKLDAPLASFYVDNVLFYNGTYSSLNGINNIIAENGIKCYPSIATDKLTVSANSEIAEISIVSLLGQTIKTQLVKAISNTIDLNNLATGNYFVRVKMENGQVGALKFVKQ